jgi:hypothetical protein
MVGLAAAAAADFDQRYQQHQQQNGQGCSFQEMLLDPEVLQQQQKQQQKQMLGGNASGAATFHSLQSQQQQSKPHLGLMNQLGQQQDHIHLQQQQQQQQQQMGEVVKVGSREVQQQTLHDLQQQLLCLKLQQAATQQQIQATCLQQPCLPLQERSRLGRQLNDCCLLLTTLLLGACAGYCGSSSAELFPQLLQHVGLHNAQVMQAAADGLVGADRLQIDVLSLKEKQHGRSLMHLLVCEFPAPELKPDGSLELHGPQELVQLVARTAALAADIRHHNSAAAAAAAAPAAQSGMGAAGSRECATPGLRDVLEKAAAAAEQTAAAAAAAAASSSSSGDGRVSTLDAHQRGSLLAQLRGLAVQQGRWGEVLGTCNSNGVTAWLTACHWCLPEVLEFYMQDEGFELQPHMLCPTKNGACAAWSLPIACCK